MNLNLPLLEWRGAPPDVESIEPLGEGDFCVCYLVNRTHVLRLAKHAKATASLRREMLLLPHLEDCLGVQIPRIRGAGVQAQTGEQFVFYPLVPGTVLWPEVMSSLEPACRSAIVREMAAFATRLHSFPVERARACGLDEIDPRSYPPDLMRRAGESISRLLDAEVWRYHARLLELYLDTPEFHDYAPSLLHGDLSPGHFLGDLGRCALSGVIDFGDCLIGDPRRDLIFILEDYGGEVLDLFLTFYSPDSERQTGRLVKVFQQLDNMSYCLSMQSAGSKSEFEEAIRTLARQATTEALALK